MAHCNVDSCSCATDVCLHISLGSCSCPTQQQQQQQQQLSNKKRKQGHEEETQQTNIVVVGTNSEIKDDVYVPWKNIKKENSNLLDYNTKMCVKICNDDAVGTNSDDWDYYLPLKKRKIKKEKSNLDGVSSTRRGTQIANKRETKNNNNNKKKTCNVDDEWEIKKVLEKSDVCRTLGRLLLKKESTQEFVIPVLLDVAEAAKRKGVKVQIWDVDTKSLHSLIFKIWTSAQSYVFTKRWVKDFVFRRKIKKGDQIGLHWDRNNQRFNFSVLENKQDGSKI